MTLTAERSAKCPKCGAADSAPIMYGYPFFDPEQVRALDAGEVVLGGCAVSTRSPAWQCRRCDWEFGDVPGQPVGS